MTSGILEIEDRSDLSRDDHTDKISWSSTVDHPLGLFIQMVVEDQLLLIDLLLNSIWIIELWMSPVEQIKSP